MELLPVQSDGEWEALLEGRADRSLYHTTAWLRFEAEQFGFELHRLVIHDASGPVGLFPLFLARRAVFRVAASPRGVDDLNLGPLVRPELLGGTLDAYERWAREQRVDFTSVAFMREIDAEVARQRGYKCERHLLCVGDLRGGEDAVFARCKQACRRTVRKAQRDGVRIVEGGLEPHLDLYLKLSERIYARSGAKSPLSKPVLAGMLRALEDSGRLLALRAQLGDDVIGMYVVGHYGATAYSLDLVTDYAFSRFSAANLLTWHAMRWGARRGLETFDFGGARIASLARFKTSFGGVLVPYSNISKAHSLLARSATWLKHAMADRIRAARFRRSRKGERSGQPPPADED